MKGFRAARQRSWSGTQSVPSHRASSVVLAWPLVFELLVRIAVVEKLVSCQHHGKSGRASFLHIDIFVVILLTCSSSAFRGEILHQYPA